MTLGAEHTDTGTTGLTGWLSNLIFGQRPDSGYDDTLDGEDRDIDRLGDTEELRGRYDDHTPLPGSQQRRSRSPESFIHAPIADSRNRRKRLIKLTSSGNLVVDCPIPERLKEAITEETQSARSIPKEFLTMRYTAVCCGPDEFAANGYTLRQQMSGRKTDLFIVMTLYNEDEILLTRTMHGVMKNIAHFCGSRRWGRHGWKRIVVSIVADGRNVINQRVLDVLTTMGVYQPGIAKHMVDDKPVQAHLYEYTTQMSIDPDMEVKGKDRAIVPVQILLCIKEKNMKKINSHRWFFNAFSPVLNPEVCVLLDVGTRPAFVSIYKLWKTFEQFPHVGGACGEIRAMLGPACLSLLNPLVASQNFEYKMSNILDKPLETMLGYISVLPGAFSAYRYSALQSDINGQGPLAKYFRGEDLAHTGGGLFERNMYLAEDRILCFELVAKRGHRWLLHYVKSAFAETDVPNNLPEFISQRRRWLNGSFFAGVYALWNFGAIWKSQHSWTRMSLLCIQALYNVVTLLFSWLSLGNFYIAFYYITKSLADPDVDPFGHGWGARLSDVFRYAYLFLIIVAFIGSMGNRPQSTKPLFTVCMAGFSVIMAYMLFATIWLVYKTLVAATGRIAWTSDTSMNAFLALHDTTVRDILVSLTATYGLYIVSSLLYMQPWHMLTSFLPYLFLLPGYVNILTIYAFCNTHDVSWGTKGDNTMQSDLGVATKVSEPGEVAVELPAGQVNINQDYEDALKCLQKQKNVESAPSPPSQEDYYRSFRTYLVLSWVACNALLAVLITSTSFDSILTPAVGTTYLTVILWINAGLAAFRFFGSIMYLLFRLFSSS